TPPPAAAPAEARAEPPAERPDPLELLWGHRLNFAAGGAPLVTIRLMEGQEEIAFRPRGPARLEPRGAADVAVAANEVLRVRARPRLRGSQLPRPTLPDGGCGGAARRGARDRPRGAATGASPQRDAGELARGGAQGPGGHGALQRPGPDRHAAPHRPLHAVQR